MGKSWHCIWNKLGQVCGGLKITDKDIALGCLTHSFLSTPLLTHLGFCSRFPLFPRLTLKSACCKSVIFPFIHRRHHACFLAAFPHSYALLKVVEDREKQRGREETLVLPHCPSAWWLCMQAIALISAAARENQKLWKYSILLL